MSEIAEKPVEKVDLRKPVEAWMAELPDWERQAASSLLEGSAVPDVVATTYPLFLHAKGLGEGSPVAAKISPTAESAPAPAVPAAADHPVVLTRIHEVVGVNALEAGQPIELSAGLNVVYGQNGSGKSGFARILRASCFSRSKDRKVHPNVMAHGAPTPAAKMVFQAGASSFERDWKDGSTLAELNDRFVFFDSSAVSAYIDDANALVVSLPELELFASLVKVLQGLKERLRTDVAARTPRPGSPVVLVGESCVSQLLASLSKDSPLEEIRRLAVFGDTERQRLEALTREIGELRTVNPAREERRLSQLRDDLTRVTEDATSFAASLGADIEAALRELVARRAQLQQKAAAASAAEFGSEPITAVGTDAWIALVRAAIAFSSELHGREEFPADVADSRCVLCQQPLSPEATERLRRFWRYVSDGVKADLEKIEQEIEAATKRLRDTATTLVASDSALLRELTTENPGLLKTLLGWQDRATARRDALAGLRAASPIDAFPSEQVAAFIDTLNERIRGLRAGDHAKRLAEAESEARLLQHRQQLANVLAAVERMISDWKWVDLAGTAAAALSHTHVTNKGKELAKQLVSANYAEGFRTECVALDFAVPVTVKMSGDEGSTVRSLAVGSGKVPTSQVLSEGEQRCVALADLLTQAALRGDVDGLVFDDPVNSLDHRRKDLIAKRLVAEAKKRQVIIFTHDLVFLSALMNEVKRQSQPVRSYTVARHPGSGSPGHVNIACFPHEAYEGQARKKAQECLDGAAALSGVALDEKLLLGVSHLRTAYEDFIQTHLFGDVVRRWRENIKYTLSKVYFDKETAADVDDRMASLSSYVPAHSHSALHTETPVSAELLKQEIAHFDRISKEYGNRKKTNAPDIKEKDLYA